MTIKILKASEYLKMPWKNGQGHTLQIACSHSSMEHFDWRISIADVNQDSTFSLFKNKSRFISILEGNGIVLNNQNTQKDINLKANEIYDFCGDSLIDSKLIDGPIRDFNLIYDPIKYHAAMDYCEQHQNKINLENFKFIFLFNPNKSDLNIKINHADYILREYETLKIENNFTAKLDLNVVNSFTSYYVITLQ